MSLKLHWIAYLHSTILDLNRRAGLESEPNPRFTFHYFRFELVILICKDHILLDLHSTLLDLNPASTTR